ncbi:hypothetical protein ACIPY3_19140 [Paenarthrobacter sp. NPDC089714]|uniref:hypothetical protein n=1 Tax=Paenarthrobacter sp. NPDC089714 TaxID=3364377 RepID=UPI003828AD5E
MALTVGINYRRTAAAVATASFAAMSLSGCISYWGGAPPCMPPDYAVSPTAARPGDSVTITAEDATCDPRYGHDARVLIVVKDSTGVEVLTTTAPMADAGGFSYTFQVPATMKPGIASVGASPDGVDWCDDTGRNNRVGRGEPELQRASCAERVKPLNISR